MAPEVEQPHGQIERGEVIPKAGPIKIVNEAAFDIYNLPERVWALIYTGVACSVMALMILFICLVVRCYISGKLKKLKLGAYSSYFTQGPWVETENNNSSKSEINISPVTDRAFFLASNDMEKKMESILKDDEPINEPDSNIIQIGGGTLQDSGTMRDSDIHFEIDRSGEEEDGGFDTISSEGTIRPEFSFNEEQDLHNMF